MLRMRTTMAMTATKLDSGGNERIQEIQSLLSGWRSEWRKHLMMLDDDADEACLEIQKCLTERSEWSKHWMRLDAYVDESSLDIQRPLSECRSE